MAAKHNRRRKPRANRRKPKVSNNIIRPRVIRFKRSYCETVVLNPNSIPSGWTLNGNAFTKQMVFNLDSLPEKTDFTNLFRQYKLVGVRSQCYYSNTNASQWNQNAIMYYSQNYAGVSDATSLDEQYFLNRPRSKKRLLLNTLGKPAADLYQPLRQLSLMYGTSVNTEYGSVRPRWISTTEPVCQHYGLDVHIARTDGLAFTTGSQSPYPTLKIIHTVYIACMGLQ